MMMALWQEAVVVIVYRLCVVVKNKMYIGNIKDIIQKLFYSLHDPLKYVLRRYTEGIWFRSD